MRCHAAGTAVFTCAGHINGLEVVVPTSGIR